MTKLMDELVEIGAKQLASDEERSHRWVEYQASAEAILNAVLPVLAQRMREYSDGDFFEAGTNSYYDQDLCPRDRENPRKAISPAHTFRMMLDVFVAKEIAPAPGTYLR